MENTLSTNFHKDQLARLRKNPNAGQNQNKPTLQGYGSTSSNLILPKVGQGILTQIEDSYVQNYANYSKFLDFKKTTDSDVERIKQKLSKLEDNITEAEEKSREDSVENAAKKLKAFNEILSKPAPPKKDITLKDIAEIMKDVFKDVFTKPIKTVEDFNDYMKAYNNLNDK
tara:strand:+ start:457 stop:969 length:513 start_codon:yes stop_codon:yes gene_type:complete